MEQNIRVAAKLPFKHYDRNGRTSIRKSHVRGHISVLVIVCRGYERARKREVGKCCSKAQLCAI